MGFSNFLVQKYGVGMTIDILQEKYPPLVSLIDNLNANITLPECIIKWFLEHKQFVIDQTLNAKIINLNEKQIDWNKYTERFLTEPCPINVILDILNDLGISEISGLNIQEFLKHLTEFNDAKS